MKKRKQPIQVPPKLLPIPKGLSAVHAELFKRIQHEMILAGGDVWQAAGDLLIRDLATHLESYRRKLVRMKDDARELDKIAMEKFTKMAAEQWNLALRSARPLHLSEDALRRLLAPEPSPWKN